MFQSSMTSIQQSLERHIKLSSEAIFLEFSNNNQQITHSIRQFLAGDYEELDS
jgi:hypothetical protein